MARLFIVMAGGALGSGARYVLSTAVQARAGTWFPAGTFVVNLLGCAVFGLVVGLASTRPGLVTDDARIFLLAGICGGFTTFSAFGYDTLELMHSGQLALAALYVILQVVVGVAAVSSGIALAHAAS